MCINSKDKITILLNLRYQIFIFFFYHEYKMKDVGLKIIQVILINKYYN